MILVVVTRVFCVILSILWSLATAMVLFICYLNVFFQDSFVVPPKASNQTSIPLVVQAVAISVILLLFTVNWQSIGSRFTCATWGAILQN